MVYFNCIENFSVFVVVKLPDYIRILLFAKNN